MFKLSVLHFLDGIGHEIQGALAETTTHELSNTPFTPNTPHGEGIQQTANFCEAKYVVVLYGAYPNPEGKEVLVELAEQAGQTPQWRPSRKSR